MCLQTVLEEGRGQKHWASPHTPRGLGTCTDQGATARQGQKSFLRAQAREGPRPAAGAGKCQFPSQRSQRAHGGRTLPRITMIQQRCWKRTQTFCFPFPASDPRAHTLTPTPNQYPSSASAPRWGRRTHSLRRAGQSPRIPASPCHKSPPGTPAPTPASSPLLPPARPGTGPRHHPHPNTAAPASCRPAALPQHRKGPGSLTPGSPAPLAPPPGTRPSRLKALPHGDCGHPAPPGSPAPHRCPEPGQAPGAQPRNPPARPGPALTGAAEAEPGGGGDDGARARSWAAGAGGGGARVCPKRAPPPRPRPLPPVGVGGGAGAAKRLSARPPPFTSGPLTGGPRSALRPDVGVTEEGWEGPGPGKPRRQKAKPWPRAGRSSPSHAPPRQRRAGGRLSLAGPTTAAAAAGEGGWGEGEPEVACKGRAARLPPSRAPVLARARRAGRGRRAGRAGGRGLVVTGGARRPAPSALEDTAKMAASAAALRHLAPLGARLARLPPRGRAAGRLLQQRRGIRLSAPAAIQVAGPPRGVRIAPKEGLGERGSSLSGEAAGSRGGWAVRRGEAARLDSPRPWRVGSPAAAGRAPALPGSRCLAGDGAGRAQPGAGWGAGAGRARLSAGRGGGSVRWRLQGMWMSLPGRERASGGPWLPSPALQISRGLWKKYGDKRVIDTPISEVRLPCLLPWPSLPSAAPPPPPAPCSLLGSLLFQMGFTGIAVGAAMVCKFAFLSFWFKN